MKEYSFNNKKKEQQTVQTLNYLIYDYLMKMKFEKSAKTFACESYIEDLKINDGPSILLRWYVAFNDISSVRCGMSSNLSDLSRIEGVMLKLENEKKRYQQMGRMDQMPYFKQSNLSEVYKQHNPHLSIPYHYDYQKYVDPRKQVDMRNMHNRPRYDEPPMSKIKGVGRFDKSLSPKIYEPSSETLQMSDKPFYLREVQNFSIAETKVRCSALSREHNILFTVCDDKTVCAFNCTTMAHECKADTNHKQIISIRIKDTPDAVWIVGFFGTNELVVIRYVVPSFKFEIMGFLRGHNEEVVCFDIADDIFSVDASGIMRRWNFQGVCEKEELLSGNITNIFSISENNLILSDPTRTYLYDYELNMEITEISKSQLVFLKRHNSLFILIFKEKVVICDQKMNLLKMLSVHNIVKDACLMDNDIVIGTSHLLIYETHGRLTKFSLNDNSEVVNVDAIGKFKPNHAIVLDGHGNCVLVSKCLHD